MNIFDVKKCILWTKKCIVWTKNLILWRLQVHSMKNIFAYYELFFFILSTIFFILSTIFFIVSTFLLRSPPPPPRLWHRVRRRTQALADIKLSGTITRIITMAWHPQRKTTGGAQRNTFTLVHSIHLQFQLSHVRVGDRQRVHTDMTQKLSQTNQQTHQNTMAPSAQKVGTRPKGKLPLS
jgi:hypothetical protein